MKGSNSVCKLKFSSFGQVRMRSQIMNELLKLATRSNVLKVDVGLGIVDLGLNFTRFRPTESRKNHKITRITLAHKISYFRISMSACFPFRKPQVPIYPDTENSYFIKYFWSKFSNVLHIEKLRRTFEQK